MSKSTTVVAPPSPLNLSLDHHDLLLGELSGPDDGPMNLRKVVVVWKRGWRRCLTVELAAKQATDVFRPVAVSPGGALYQLQTTEHQVLVRRWDLSAREVTP